MNKQIQYEVEQLPSNEQEMANVLADMYVNSYPIIFDTLWKAQKFFCDYNIAMNRLPCGTHVDFISSSAVDPYGDIFEFQFELEFRE